MTSNGQGDTDASGLIARLKAIFRGSKNDTLSTAIVNGEAGRHLPPARREMIERVIAFDEKKVVDVMAPRADVYAVDFESSLNDLIQFFSKAGHSRMPVYRGDLDDPVGMVHIKDVVAMIADGTKHGEPGAPILKSLRREILYAPPSMRVTDLLLRMQASRIHMALVIDEYGGTDGLVTIEDLIEEIVGEINDEHDDDAVALIMPHPDGGWDVDARVELETFAAETGISFNTADDEIDTLGGLVFSLAGRVPQRGEVIVGPNGLDFEVTEADPRKVRKIRIRPAAAERNEAAE